MIAKYHKLNLFDGGKNTPKLSNSFNTNSQGDTCIHEIQTVDGKQKGINTILQKQGIWRNGTKKPEALHLLLAQLDFFPE